MLCVTHWTLLIPDNNTKQIMVQHVMACYYRILDFEKLYGTLKTNFLQILYYTFNIIMIHSYFVHL